MENKKKKNLKNIKKLLLLWSNMVLNFSFFPFRFASILGAVLKYTVKVFRKNNEKLQYEILEKTF